MDMTALQKEWDRHLIRSWYGSQNIKTYTAVNRFMDVHKLSFEEVEQLKRVPARFSMKWDFRFWMNRCLRKLWMKLVDISEDDVLARAQLLTKLQNSTLKTSEPYVDRASQNERARLKNEVRQNVVSATVSKVRIEGMYASHRPSGQWGVCK